MLMPEEVPKSETAKGRQLQAADPSKPKTRDANVPSVARPINGQVGSCYIDSLVRVGNELHLTIHGKTLTVSIAAFLDARRFQAAAIERIGEAVYYKNARDFRDQAVHLLSKWEGK
jgi:hypothetical protein